MLVCCPRRLLARVESKFWNSEQVALVGYGDPRHVGCHFRDALEGLFISTATISNAPLLGFPGCRLAGGASVCPRPTDFAALHSSPTHAPQCVHSWLLLHGPFLRRAQSALRGSRIITARSSPCACRFRITTTLRSLFRDPTAHHRIASSDTARTGVSFVSLALREPLTAA